MMKEEILKLTQDIEIISGNFEDKPFTDNIRLLKEDLDFNSLSSPNHYLETIVQFEELLRQTRLLFLFSVFNRLCVEEEKLYYFDNPYEAGMKYSAIMKKEDTFFLLDEDGHFKEMFVSEKFVRYVDDSYWKLYEQE